MKIDDLKLKILMIKQGFTTERLSQKAHVGAATITAVRGGKACSPNTAAHLAEALGVELEALLPDGEEVRGK